jgi:hypothetical protein
VFVLEKDAKEIDREEKGKAQTLLFFFFFSSLRF